METDPRRDEDTAEGGALDSELEGDRERSQGENDETAEGGALDDADAAGTEPARGFESEHEG